MRLIEIQENSINQQGALPCSFVYMYKYTYTAL